MSKFILIASDVHSDDEVFEKLCKIASDENCLAFIYAGDLNIENYFIGDVLRKRNFVFIPVLGNCDNPFSFQDAGLPTPSLYKEVTINNLKLFVTHGHFYTDPESVGLENNNFDVVITGHTHIPKIVKEGKTVYLNPGSASRPRGYSSKSYATITFSETGPLIKTINL